MALVDKKKLGALVEKNKKQKQPPKKPGGGGPPKPGQHAEEEADHEGGESAEHEQQEHDEGKDKQIAQGQAKRVANGKGEDDLHELALDVGGPDEDGAKAPPPEWASDHDVWERAEKAVDSLEDLDEGDRDAVLVHTYKALGGAIDKGGEGGDDGGGGGDQ